MRSVGRTHDYTFFKEPERVPPVGYRPEAEVSRDISKIKQSLASDDKIVVTQDIFSRLLPAAERFKNADPCAVWHEFDQTLIDALLNALKSGRVAEIVDRKGVHHRGIEISLFCQALYHKSEDLDKAKTAEACFNKTFGN